MKNVFFVMRLSCTDDDGSQHVPSLFSLSPPLFLPLPFCRLRAEKQLTDTRGENMLSSFYLFFSFSLLSSQYFFLQTEMCVAPSNENFQVPKAGIEYLQIS